MEVEMRIRGLLMDPVTNTPIVILKDANSDAVLPIWVGVFEANAIALEIEKVSTPRPMTHDLIKNVLSGLDAHVHKVVVTELKEDTFFAYHQRRFAPLGRPGSGPARGLSDLCGRRGAEDSEEADQRRRSRHQ